MVIFLGICLFICMFFIVTGLLFAWSITAPRFNTKGRLDSLLYKDSPLRARFRACARKTIEEECKGLSDRGRMECISSARGGMLCTVCKAIFFAIVFTIIIIIL